MNESSGSVMYDDSGYGRNGTIANSQWVGGFMNSDPNYTFTYGYFEARIQGPLGNSGWPAWVMYAPCCNSRGTPNELDIFEMNAAFDGVNGVSQTDHSETCGSGQSGCYYVTTSLSPIPSSGFHRYGVLWTSSGVTFYIDGTATVTIADTSLTTAMYLSLTSGVVTPNYGPTYAPNPAEYPTYVSVSGVWAFNPGASGCGSTTLPTGTTALSNTSYCINNVTYTEESPPTDSFDTFNQYNATTNPSGTWETTTEGGSARGGFMFIGDNTTAGFDIWPFSTGSSGLTIETQYAPNEVSGYEQSALVSGDTYSLGTLGSANDVVYYQHWNYLESGYDPVSGSFSAACYVSIPTIMGSPVLFGSNDVAYQSPENEGWDIGGESGEVSLSIGYGTGTSTTSSLSLSTNTPEAFVITYNSSTEVATLYIGNTSSPESTSETLPSAYVASATPVYFNTYWGTSRAGGQYGPCAEWDGTVLTSAQVDAITAATV